MIKIMPVFKDIALKDLDSATLEKLSAVFGYHTHTSVIPASLLIDEIGLRGKMIGDAKISDTDANCIEVRMASTPEVVTIMISYIKQQVRDAFGIQLQEHNSITT